MPDKVLTRERYGEAFWRADQGARSHSALNQREYCEAQGLRSSLRQDLAFVRFAEPPTTTLVRRWDDGAYRQVMTKSVTRL